jgi:hypothetical protein
MRFMMPAELVLARTLFFSIDFAQLDARSRRKIFRHWRFMRRVWMILLRTPFARNEERKKHIREWISICTGYCYMLAYAKDMNKYVALKYQNYMSFL